MTATPDFYNNMYATPPPPRPLSKSQRTASSTNSLVSGPESVFFSNSMSSRQNSKTKGKSSNNSQQQKQQEPRKSSLKSVPRFSPPQQEQGQEQLASVSYNYNLQEGQLSYSLELRQNPYALPPGFEAAESVPTTTASSPAPLASPSDHKSRNAIRMKPKDGKGRRQRSSPKSVVTEETHPFDECSEPEVFLDEYNTNNEESFRQGIVLQKEGYTTAPSSRSRSSRSQNNNKGATPTKQADGSMTNVSVTPTSSIHNNMYRLGRDPPAEPLVLEPRPKVKKRARQTMPKVKRKFHRMPNSMDSKASGDANDNNAMNNHDDDSTSVSDDLKWAPPQLRFQIQQAAWQQQQLNYQYQLQKAQNVEHNITNFRPTPIPQADQLVEDILKPPVHPTAEIVKPAVQQKQYQSPPPASVVRSLSFHEDVKPTISALDDDASWDMKEDNDDDVEDGTKKKSKDAKKPYSYLPPGEKNVMKIHPSVAKHMESFHSMEPPTFCESLIINWTGIMICCLLIGVWVCVLVASFADIGNDDGKVENGAPRFHTLAPNATTPNDDVGFYDTSAPASSTGSSSSNNNNPNIGGDDDNDQQPALPNQNNYGPYSDLTEEELKDLLWELLPDYTTATIQRDSNSPQASAWTWLVEDVTMGDASNSNSDEQILQRFALATLYYATVGDTWTFRASHNWLSHKTTECEWYSSPEDGYGIVCTGDNNSNNDQVQKVALPNHNLQGIIPPEMFGLVPSLTLLNLGSNTNLSGSIPSEVGLASNLVGLDLHDNALWGAIPSEIGLLRKLLWLTLADQVSTDNAVVSSALSMIARQSDEQAQQPGLSSSMPTTLGLLTKLQHLRLENNRLTGQLPVELANLTDLVTLVLRHNLLTGQIPVDFGWLVQLQGLALDQNQLFGSIPSEFSQLSNLSELHLSHNQLTGPLPASLSALANTLTWLALSDNALTGSLPVSWNELAQLQTLQLETILPWWEIFPWNGVLIGLHCNECGLKILP
jgi:Leucine-rich repeat (LRR) protein